MKTLATRALLAEKIRLGQKVLFFYMLTITAAGVLEYFSHL